MEDGTYLGSRGAAELGLGFGATSRGGGEFGAAGRRERPPGGTARRGEGRRGGGGGGRAVGSPAGVGSGTGTGPGERREKGSVGILFGKSK
jgi:hypothetical protein